MSRASTQQILRQVPVSWAVSILVLLVVYWFAQPALNSRLGLHLPSLASLLGEPETKPAKTPAERTESKPSKSERSSQNPSAQVPKTASTQDNARPAETDDGPNDVAPVQPSSAPNQTKAKPKTNEEPSAAASTRKSPAVQSNDLLYGLLKETGRQRYVSPEGLQYNPGSEEGHRLKHLERHLKDQPDRPGKHGVFEGDMPQVLTWIDDAYARGKRGAKGVRKQEEGDRTIYEVPFKERIGYVGGKDGRRDGHPEAKRLRLVTDGNRFITAFPY